MPYLYALADTEDLLLPAVGIAEKPLRTVTHAGIVAVISDAPPGRLRPERRLLAAHQNVLRELMKQRTILPVVFGVVPGSTADLKSILVAHADALAEQLARVRDRVEMTLRVAWDVPNIFLDFVERHRDLRDARDTVVDSGAHDAKMRAGRLFEQLRDQERDAHNAAVRQHIDPIAFEIVENAPRADADVLGMACLVDRPRLPDFEAAVHAAAHGFDDRFRFDFSGPWAPHSFVRMDLSVPESADA